MNVKFFNKIRQIRKYTINTYIIAMFSIFLFYFQNYYFDITPAKFQCFLYLTTVMIVLCILLNIILLKDPNTKFSEFSFASLSITDKAMLLLLGSHFITTLFSAYPSESMYGTAGRQLGLNFTILTTFAYFFISRYASKVNQLLHVLLLCTALVIGLGLLHFYGIDFFHFFDNLTVFDQQRFLSTIGNITFFAHLMCLTLPLSVFLYTTSVDKKNNFLYGTLVLLGFLGLFISNLDGAYLGICAFLLYYLYYCLQDHTRCKKCIEVILLAFAAVKGLYAIFCFYPNAGRGLATLSFLLGSTDLTTYVFVLLFLCYFFMIYKEESMKKLPYQTIRKYVFIGLGLLILGLLSVFFYFSFIDTKTNLGSAANYLRFSMDWGTGRGFIWITLLTIMMQHFSVIQFLFGNGVDTTRILMTNYAQQADASYYDNAHNEYIQYLVTTGIVGLILYLTVLISLMVRLWKQHQHNPYLLGLLGCLIAHSAQAITGLNQPITTPIFFLLLALSEYYLRRSKEGVEDAANW